jgi:hypothetical protein
LVRGSPVLLGVAVRFRRVFSGVTHRSRTRVVERNRRERGSLSRHLGRRCQIPSVLPMNVSAAEDFLHTGYCGWAVCPAPDSHRRGFSLECLLPRLRGRTSRAIQRDLSLLVFGVSLLRCICIVLHSFIWL